MQIIQRDCFLKFGGAMVVCLALLTASGRANDLRRNVGVAVLSQAGNVLVFPQFVTLGGYVTTVTLINTNFNSTVTGTLFVYNQDGSPRTTAIDGQTSGSQFPITIPSGGTVVLSTTPGGGNPVSGMARFVSDYPAGGVVRFQFSGGQVGVLNAPFQSVATLLLNTANGNDTGIAIANANSVPINISLAYVDATGHVVETISPSYLNPLPAFGQVARFAENFGFSTSLSNLSAGSIQILLNGSGQFNAFGLLFKGGFYASTATLPGAYQHFEAEQFQGSYTGQWNNNFFSTTGGAAASIAVDPHTRSIAFLLTLTGAVFGGSNPAPTLLTGNYSDTGFTTTGNSDLFGPATMTVNADGTFTFTANSVPGGLISTFNITGTAFPDKINGNYTIGLPGEGTATGTLVLNHTNQ